MLKPLNNISLDEAYDLLLECPAVMIDDQYIIVPKINELKDLDDNIFMSFHWTIKGLEFELHFKEGDNLEIAVEGSSMYLLDNNSEDELDFTIITLLCPKNLEEKV